MIELRNLIQREIQKESNQQEWLNIICDQYIKYYNDCTLPFTTSLTQLLTKYNGDTISGYIGKAPFPIGCVHLALFHSLGEKELFPCLDNNGSIYSVEREMGAITNNPNIIISGDDEHQMMLRYKYHTIIFMCWLTSGWMEVEGYKYNMVVKTLENNSTDAFYFNNFQFNSKSKFHSDTDCRDTVTNFTLKEINTRELFNRMMERYG